MARKRRNPWQRILRASERGRGLRLTAREVLRLSNDLAIETVADHHTDGCNLPANGWDCKCMEGQDRCLT